MTQRVVDQGAASDVDAFPVKGILQKADDVSSHRIRRLEPLVRPPLSARGHATSDGWAHLGPGDECSLVESLLADWEAESEAEVEGLVRRAFGPHSRDEVIDRLSDVIKQGVDRTLS